MSWTFQGLTRRTGHARLTSIAIAGWILLSGATVLLTEQRDFPEGQWELLRTLRVVGVTVLALGTLIGLAVVLRRLRSVRRTERMLFLVLESLEVSSCAVLVLWGVNGNLRALPPDRLGSVLVACTQIALVQALARLSSHRVRGGEDDGRGVSFPWGSAAFLSFALSHGFRVLPSDNGRPNSDLVPWLFVTGCLLLSFCAWRESFGRSSPECASEPSEFFSLVVLIFAVVSVSVRYAVGERGELPVILLAVVAFLAVAGRCAHARENRASVEELGKERKRFSDFLENTEEAALEIDENGRIRSAGSAVRKLLMVGPESLVGRRATDLLHPRNRDDVRTLLTAMGRGERGTGLVRIELLPPAVGIVDLRLRRTGAGAVATFTDVTETEALREHVDRLTRFDQLTALPNRAHLLGTTDSWLDSGGRATVFHLDVVGFQSINDRFGRESGDKVLVEVAARLRGAVDGLGAVDSIIARVGNDEFVISVRQTQESRRHRPTAGEESGNGKDEDGGRTGRDGTAAETRTARRILASVRPSFLVGDRTVRLDLSIGVARSADLPSEGGASLLLHRGGIALARAKRAGRGSVVCWDRSVEQETLRRVDIAIGLRRALDTARLRLAYQPVVRLSDGVVVGVEALVRVRQGRGSSDALSWLPDVVSPEELVAVAESSGVIDELGEWVLVEAMRQAARWRAQGHDLSVGVNVSVHQLAAGGLPDLVRRVLRSSELPPDRLVIEVTESELLGEGDPAVEELRALAQDGVVLAIDGFGTGYSSLSYLLRLPVRSVKMDRQMLVGLGEEPRATTLVRSVISMVRALGMLVVVEGLEDSRTLRLVRDLGVYCGQGFVLCKALPPEELDSVLRASPLDLSLEGGRHPVGRGQDASGTDDGPGPSGRSGGLPQEVSPADPGAVPPVRSPSRCSAPPVRRTTVVVSDRETGRGGD
jgi:PAS domain S-box-containing protein